MAKMAKFDPDKTIKEAEATIKAATDRKAKKQGAVDKAQASVTAATKRLQAAQAKVAEEDALISRTTAYLERNRTEDDAPPVFTPVEGDDAA